MWFEICLIKSLYRPKILFKDANKVKINKVSCFLGLPVPETSWVDRKREVGIRNKLIIYRQTKTITGSPGKHETYRFLYLIYVLL